MTNLFRDSSTHKAQNGVALIAVLAVVTLVSLFIVTFMFVVQQERYASRNYAQSVKAEEVGIGALDNIVSQIRQEIIAGSVTTNSISGKTIYLPTANFTTAPAYVGADPALTNMVQRSVGDDATYNAAYSNSTYYPNPPPVNLASPINSTGSSSFNGRSISLARWSKPQLASFSSAAQTPDWIILTRQGAKQFTTWDATLNDKSDSNYALGRYSYVIYNVGGLLNANVAGYATNTPPSGTAFDRQIGAKNSTVWADLTALGLTQTQVDSLVAWRNSKNATSATNYLSYVTNFGATNGFTKVDGDATASDNAFLSRQDLIDYATANKFTDQLPYLTTFSKQVNSPSAIVNNVNLTTVDPGGTPLKKFPLSKISLLSIDNPSASDIAQIQKYFGLVESTGFSKTYRHWTYTSLSGNAAPINTLATIAGKNKQPNLFEVLLAGIQKGSLGKPGVDGTPIGNDLLLTYKDDSNPYHQVIRIGANVIDQATTTNYPTVIDFADGTGNTYQFYGIKNLPYFSELFIKYMINSLKTTTYPEEHYVFFQLWNPHRNASVLAKTTPSIQIKVNPEAQISLNYGEVVSTFSGIEDSIDIGISSTNTYSSPSLIINSATPGCTYTLGAKPSISLPITFCGWKFPDITNNTASIDTVKIINAVFQLQYLDSSGIYRTYTTFGGLLKSDGTVDLTNYPGLYAPDVQYDLARVGDDVYIGESSLIFMKADPRTNRFGASSCDVAYKDWPSDPTKTSLAPNGLYKQGELQLSFFAPIICGLYQTSHLSRLWTNQDSETQAHDTDGAKRPGDGYLGDSSSNNNPMMDQSDSNSYAVSRPVILNRPYQSVGELGYVFRDQPWKTLDLFSSQSADSALLDMFCINEEEATIRSDTININTPHPLVLQSLLRNAYRDSIGSGSTNQISISDANTIAQDITTSSQTNTFSNISDLITKTANYSSATVTPLSAYPSVKSLREAVPRALASVGTTRTWNLMIDIVAQTGKYPITASSLDNFQVEGEKRYWLHISIDRYTDEIIDQSLEPVYE